MAEASFRALVLEQREGAVEAAVRELPGSALPQGDVLVDVAYSSLNYKDGLAITGTGKLIRTFPMVPGIDFAGTVVESTSPAYRFGDQVVLTGWGVGERHWGGLAQRARAKAGWLTPLPEGLTLKQAMGVGTAGLTAMLCVLALEEHGVNPGGREVLVTGAAGGVGSVAVALLANLGYKVAASTGRASAHEFLRSLGAVALIDRDTLCAPSPRPLEAERWGGVVDTVGGETLASALKATAYGGSVTACGLAGGNSLPATVLPFILRGVNLLGIDSVMCPAQRRQHAWQRLAADLKGGALERIVQTVGLGQVPALAQEILKGQVRGRIVVDVNA